LGFSSKKESSDSEPRRGAGEAEGEGGGWGTKKLGPEVNCFLLLVLLEGSRPISAGGTRYSHLVQ